MLSTPIRTTAPAGVFMGEIFRQPWLLFIVVLGPFLILMAFALGARIYRDYPSTIVVQPPNGTIGSEGFGAGSLDRTLTIVDTTSDRAGALERLKRGEVKLVLELPANPEQAIARGEQAQVRLYTNEIDPVASSFTSLYVESQVAELNRQAIVRTAEQVKGSADGIRGDVDRLATTLEGFDGLSIPDQRARLAEANTLLAQIDSALVDLQSLSGWVDNLFGGAVVPSSQLGDLRTRVAGFQRDIGQIDQQLGKVPTDAEIARLRQGVGDVQTVLGQVRTVNPEVIASPFKAAVENVAPFQPQGTTYFLPGILALVLQHFALTLAAVSAARDRRLGILDVYRLSPASPGEVMTGKYLGLGVMVALVATAVTLLVIVTLGVPILAGVGWLAFVMFLFLFASLALGFVVGMITRTEAAAIQASMLILIASVAFGGMLAPLDQLLQPLRSVAFLLPVTTGRVLLETVMFRVAITDWTAPAVLGGVLLVSFVVSYLLFARELGNRSAAA